MANQFPKINNVACSWAMIELKATAFGDNSDLILSGVTSIKWSRKWKVATNYGLGGKPVSRGFGNWEYTASITMDYNAQSAIRAIAVGSGGEASLTALGEFDLVISWASESSDTAAAYLTESVTLKGCVFTEDGMEASQDDTNITKEFDLNPFDIAINSGSVTTPYRSGSVQA